MTRLVTKYYDDDRTKEHGIGGTDAELSYKTRENKPLGDRHRLENNIKMNPKNLYVTWIGFIRLCIGICDELL
jgi:hypothetical protein